MKVSKDLICKALRDSKFESLADSVDAGIDNIDLLNGCLILIKSFKKISNLREEWDNVQTIVAAAIQANMELIGLDSSIAWDMYLVFFCEEPVNHKLMQDIERNKFCCKKYVFQIHPDQNHWEVIEDKIPLLYKWPQDASGAFVSSGGNVKRVCEKLAEGNTTALSSMMLAEEEFIDLPATEILKRLMDWEDTATGGGDSRE